MRSLLLFLVMIGVGYSSLAEQNLSSYQRVRIEMVAQKIMTIVEPKNDTERQLRATNEIRLRIHVGHAVDAIGSTEVILAEVCKTLVAPPSKDKALTENGAEGELKALSGDKLSEGMALLAAALGVPAPACPAP